MVIPEKRKSHGRRRGRPPILSCELCRRRNVIEQCIGWLKVCRRIGTRYEKLAVNYLAMVKLAVARRYIRLLFSGGT